MCNIYIFTLVIKKILVMKKTLLVLFVLASGLFFTACQEDDAMDSLIKDSNGLTEGEEDEDDNSSNEGGEGDSF